MKIYVYMEFIPYKKNVLASVGLSCTDDNGSEHVIGIIMDDAVVISLTNELGNDRRNSTRNDFNARLDSEDRRAEAMTHKKFINQYLDMSLKTSDNIICMGNRIAEWFDGLFNIYDVSRDDLSFVYSSVEAQQRLIDAFELVLEYSPVNEQTIRDTILPSLNGDILAVDDIRIHLSEAEIMGPVFNESRAIKASYKMMKCDRN